MHFANNIDLQSGVLGGLLIGASSSAFMYLNGKTTGISGIVEGVLIANAGDDKAWTLTYFLGLLSAGVLLENVIPGSFGTSPHSLTLTPEAVALAGILTGFGTRLGSGCTSGHGICGLPRRSARSLAAVCTFMGTGALAAYYSRNTDLSAYVVAVGGASSAPGSPQEFLRYLAPTASVVAVVATVFNKNFFLYKTLFGLGTAAEREKSEKCAAVAATDSWGRFVADHVVTFGCAFVMGVGLVVSGMCNPARVVNFLNFSGADGWDPTLMGVMGGGVVLNSITFHLMHMHDVEIPLAATTGQRIRHTMKMDFAPENLLINWRLLVGSAIFGLGWGLGGVCPGPALVSLGSGIKTAGLFVPYMIGGIALQEVVFGKGLPFLR
jgi:uncharacterized membrane protein YedE/YeeE